MILVDTSVWIDHLRSPEPVLQEQLIGNKVLTHPIVVGELACGNLTNRRTFLRNLDALPKIVQGTHQDIRDFIETQRLMGRGIGLMDAHLLYSVLHQTGSLLWTRDKNLCQLAQELAVSYVETT